ncbi:hypothetical protein [Litorilituus lipolyticus]|uniref:Uncharacterized protein n=1 Tax=Litorilituus lipolyticus TaxID=2491017 RepID=A0A502KP80_9GAMM|nr:hypothetical protein [Litorilituus lipolyticus]TPH13256.1 hypothetical protein EPA86_13765 [Litorilituus lipolyticus]
MAKKTSFLKIKTYSWYKYMTRGADKQAIEKAEIALQEQLDKKCSSTREEQNTLLSDIKEAKKNLKIKRRDGASIEEFGVYLRKKEKEVRGDKAILIKTKKIIDIDEEEDDEENIIITYKGYFENKTWGNYSSARQDPSRAKSENVPILKEMVELFPESLSKFEDGPSLIFRVLETVNFRGAIQAYFECISYVINESVKEGKIDTKMAERLYRDLDEYNNPEAQMMRSASTRFRQFQHIFNCIRTEDKLEENPFFGSEIFSCLNIAHSYIESKYLGNYHDLACCCFVHNDLDVIEKHYGIPKKCWFDLKISDPFKVLEEFAHAKTYFDNNSSLQILVD